MLKAQHAFSKDLLTNDKRKFNISSVVPVARVCLGGGAGGAGGVIRGLRITPYRYWVQIEVYTVSLIKSSMKVL